VGDKKRRGEYNIKRFIYNVNFDVDIANLKRKESDEVGDNQVVAV
jgi:hypothetical protein